MSRKLRDVLEGVAEALAPSSDPEVWMALQQLERALGGRANVETSRVEYPDGQ